MNQPGTDFPGLEARFVGLMMNHPDRIPEIKERVELDYFSDPGLRSGVQRLFEIPESELTSGRLTSLIQAEDPGLARMLARYSFRDPESLDLKAEVQGYIVSLRLKSYQGKQRELQKEIEAAERQGRAQEVLGLQRKKTDLSQEIESLKQQLASERRNAAE